MIPRFARNGLLPPGEHGCEWPEFAARFEGTADNGRRRKQLLLGLAQMLWLLAQAGCRVCYVDGSFVTRERWPRDFDLCYEAEGIDTAKLDAIFLDFRAGRAAQKRRFGGEALPVEFPFDWSGRSVREAFQLDRMTGAAKGIIRLHPLEIAPQLEADITARQQANTEQTNREPNDGN